MKRFVTMFCMLFVFVGAIDMADASTTNMSSDMGEGEIHVDTIFFPPIDATGTTGKQEAEPIIVNTFE